MDAIVWVIVAFVGYKFLTGSSTSTNAQTSAVQQQIANVQKQIAQANNIATQQQKNLLTTLQQQLNALAQKQQQQSKGSGGSPSMGSGSSGGGARSGNTGNYGYEDPTNIWTDVSQYDLNFYATPMSQGFGQNTDTTDAAPTPPDISPSIGTGDAGALADILNAPIDGVIFDPSGNGSLDVSTSDTTGLIDYIPMVDSLPNGGDLNSADQMIGTDVNTQGSYDTSPQNGGGFEFDQFGSDSGFGGGGGGGYEEDFYF
jgi:hypothetical protein